MTENSKLYEDNMIVDINHVQVCLSDINFIEEYINKNADAAKLPESVYFALSALVSAYKGR